MLVVEKPPLRLSASIKAVAGGVYRWAEDEHLSQNVLHGLSFATTMPGGFSQATLVLPRNPYFDYEDIEELSTVQITGHSDRVAYEGRLESSPRTSGDQMAISPGLVGWQAHLDDDNSARQIYIDQLLTNWASPSLARRASLLTTPFTGINDPSVIPDPSTGEPSLETVINGSWTSSTAAVGPISESVYDAQGISIYQLIAHWAINAGVGASDGQWQINCGLAYDDALMTGVINDTMGGTGGSNGTGTPTATDFNEKYAFVQQYYRSVVGQVDGADGQDYSILWNMAVIGNHGAPIQFDGSMFGGVLCSMVEADAINTWCPQLNATQGTNGTIQTSTFVIPQLVFLTPTTAGAMIKAANQYELRDWAVWENKTYYSNARGAVGKKWRVRVGPARLQQTGPQISRLYNGVCVQYTDTGGIVRTVTPSVSSSLLDTDPTNPCNEAGINRYASLTMQTSTQAGAITVGSKFLQEQKLVDTSGQASISGHVQDDSGAWYPAWAIRGGDQIAFVDASDTSYRRVVSTSYDDSSRTNAIQLDAPPDGLQALLQRMSVVLTPLGFT